MFIYSEKLTKRLAKWVTDKNGKVLNDEELNDWLDCLADLYLSMARDRSPARQGGDRSRLVILDINHT